MAICPRFSYFFIYVSLLQPSSSSSPSCRPIFSTIKISSPSVRLCFWLLKHKSKVTNASVSVSIFVYLWICWFLALLLDLALESAYEGATIEEREKASLFLRISNSAVAFHFNEWEKANRQMSKLAHKMAKLAFHDDECRVRIESCPPPVSLIVEKETMEWLSLVDSGGDSYYNVF